MCLVNTGKTPLRTQPTTSTVNGKISAGLPSATPFKNSSKIDAPIVGSNSPYIKGEKKRTRRQLDVWNKTKPQRLFEIYVDVWKSSGIPLPNFHLTTNLPKGMREKYCQKNGKTVAAYYSYLFDAVRRVHCREGVPLFHIWVMEVAGSNIHIHSLLHVPNKEFAVKFMKSLLRQLVPKNDFSSPSIANRLFMKNSGQPIHGGWINEEVAYNNTGCYGLDGMIEYMKKDICMTSSMHKSHQFGKIVGASQTITNLFGDVQLHSVNKSSYCPKW